MRRLVWYTVALATVTVLLFAGATRAASPDGTRVTPPLTTASGEVYYIDPAGWLVRCATATSSCARTNGHAAQVLSYSGKVWVQAPSAPNNWYIYLGANKWTNTGSPVDPVPVDLSSPSGSRIPDLASIKDKAGAVWTLGGVAGDANRAILKDGVPHFGGLAIGLEVIKGDVFAFTSDGLWWQALPAAPGWVQLPDDPNKAENAAKGLTVDFTIIPAPVLPPEPTKQPS